MRKTLDGSKMLRGRKKRRNIRKLVTKNPPMLAQMMRRLILLTGGSGVLSTTAPVARAATGFGMPLATEAVGVVVDLDAPGAPGVRAAGGVAAGTSFPGAVLLSTVWVGGVAFGILGFVGEAS